MTRERLPDPHTFTWWSYRPSQFGQSRGLRIDLALCSDDIADRVERVWIDVAERADDRDHERPSDHAPVVVEMTDM